MPTAVWHAAALPGDAAGGDVAGVNVAAEWWEIVAALGPAAVLGAALIGAVMAYFTLRQRSEADRGTLAQRSAADSRAEWWRRAQWALEAAVADHPRRRLLGLAALSVLAESELASEGELKLLDVAWEAVDTPVPGAPAASPSPGVQEAPTAPGNSSSQETTGIRVAAAKLRVVLDRRLGRPTPPAVQSLAQDADQDPGHGRD